MAMAPPVARLRYVLWVTLNRIEFLSIAGLIHGPLTLRKYTVHAREEKMD